MRLEEAVEAYSSRAKKLSRRAEVDFTAFCEKTLNFKLHDWQKIVTERLGRLKDEKGARIVMHGPPQYGKSVITSQRLPAYLLGTNPLRRVGLACYNISHASGFGEVVRDLMQSPEYDEMFPAVMMPKTASSEAFALPARKRLKDGTYSWVAMGLLTGFVGKGFGPGDCLIVDDPYASPDHAVSESVNESTWRWWAQTAKVRIDPEANVVVFFHRYHEDDFAGRLLAEGGWEYYRFPAIADGEPGDPTNRKVGELLSPMRTREYLDELMDRDPQTFLGMFQGLPRPPQGAFIKREWLQEGHHPPTFGRVCRFWDLAVGTKERNDYTCGALVGIDSEQNVWLLDMARFRMEWPDACRLIADITRSDYQKYKDVGTHYIVGVEKVAWQAPMLQDLFRMGIYNVVQLWPVKAVQDKKTRASGWVARARNGQFKYLKDPSWNQDFITEAVCFDGLGFGHDDQVDAVSGAYSLLWSTPGNMSVAISPPRYSKEWYEYIEKYNRFPDEDEEQPIEDEYAAPI